LSKVVEIEPQGGFGMFVNNLFRKIEYLIFKIWTYANMFVGARLGIFG